VLRLRETAYLVRKESKASRGKAAVPASRKRVWCCVEAARDDGFTVIVRAKDAQEVTAQRGSAGVRDSRWRIELGGVEYSIKSWTIVEEDKPRQFIGLVVGSSKAGGNIPALASEAL